LELEAQYSNCHSFTHLENTFNRISKSVEQKRLLDPATVRRIDDHHGGTLPDRWRKAIVF